MVTIVEFTPLSLSDCKMFPFKKGFKKQCLFSSASSPEDFNNVPAELDHAGRTFLIYSIRNLPTMKPFQGPEPE